MRTLKRIIACLGIAAIFAGCETSTEQDTPARQENPDNVQIYAAWPEAGSDGYYISRGNTDYGMAWHLGCGQRADYNAKLSPNSTYAVQVRYSNDGGSETVSVFSDETRFFERFTTENTRKSGMSPGEGWTNFVWSPQFEMQTRSESNYVFSIMSHDAEDRYGVDIDRISVVKK